VDNKFLLCGLFAARLTLPWMFIFFNVIFSFKLQQAEVSLSLGID